MSFAKVVLTKRIARHVAGGHPWIFDRAATFSHGTSAGDLVSVVSDGRDLGVGIAEPSSALAVRMLTLDPNAQIDADWVRGRARSAAALRVAESSLVGTNAYRCLHGENDYMPGIVMDLYAGVAVAMFDGVAAETFWAPYMEVIVEGLRAGGIDIDSVWGRNNAVRGSGKVLVGTPPRGDVEIDEHGAIFEVDFRRGQKTGFFLDQRDNRRLVAKLSVGLEVCNLFGYTGGFSVHAALAGARRVTTVDSAGPAIDAALRNLQRNELNPAEHPALKADVFEFLNEAITRDRIFDLVICDPPSFASSEKARRNALRAYIRLNALAMRAVRPGGALVSASCSSHIGGRDMLDIVAAAATQAARVARVVTVRGAGADHPVRPSFPEGDYLQLLVVRLD